MFMLQYENENECVAPVSTMAGHCVWACSLAHETLAAQQLSADATVCVCFVYKMYFEPPDAFNPMFVSVLYAVSFQFLHKRIFSFYFSSVSYCYFLFGWRWCRWSGVCSLSPLTFDLFFLCCWDFQRVLGSLSRLFYIFKPSHTQCTESKEENKKKHTKTKRTYYAIQW